MSIQVELTPEEEARLRERARQNGQRPEEWAGNALRPLLCPEPPQRIVERVVDENGVFHQDRWDRLMAWIKEASAGSPALPPEALTREALYADHD